MKILFDGMYSAFISSAALTEGIASAKELKIEDFYYAQAQRFKKKSLELLLLADQVELTMCEPGIDYNNLLALGYIKIKDFVVSPEEEWRKKNEFLKDPNFIGDWELYKPLIIDHIQKGLPTLMNLAFKKRKVNVKNFLDLSIDSIIGKEVLNKQIKNGGLALWDCQPEGMKIYAWDTLYLQFRIEYVYSIGKYIIGLLNNSFQDDCYLSSTLINRASIGNLNRYSLPQINSKPFNQSYDILTYSLIDVIGYLPKVDTLSQVLNMRNKKGPQLRALKNAVEEINLSFASGKKSAISKSIALIKKAEADLNRFQEINKINSWTTYISLPVAVAETLVGILPVLGMGLGTMSVVNTYLAAKLDEKNWMGLY